MYHRSKNTLVLLPVVLLLFVLPGTLRSAQISSKPTCEWGTWGSDLTVSQTSETSFYLSWVWNQISQPSSYTVTVTDVTTSTVLQSFSVSNKYTAVTSVSVPSGHTVRFSVGANGFIIAEDVLL